MIKFNKKVVLLLLILLAVSSFYFLSKNVKEKFDFDYSNSFGSIRGNIPKEANDKEEVMKTEILGSANEIKELWRVGGEFYNEVKALEKANPEISELQPEFLVTYSTSSSQKLLIINYSVQKYIFEGGANGLSILNNYSFGEKGKIEIESVLNLNPQNAIKISRIIEQKLLERFGDATEKKMVTEGLGTAYLRANNTFDSKKCNCESFDYISNLINFEILDEGVKFNFQKYQVAPGSFGQPNIVLTWQELSPFLNSNFDLPLD